MISSRRARGLPARGAGSQGWDEYLATRPLDPAGMNPRREEITFVGSRRNRDDQSVVSVPVSFVSVRPGPASSRQLTQPQVGTGTITTGHQDGDLESVLGASPQGFESPILRHPDQPERREPRIGLPGVSLFGLTFGFICPPADPDQAPDPLATSSRIVPVMCW